MVTNNNQYVTNIEDPNVLTFWTNDPTNGYDTFTIDGRNISSAIASNGSICSSNVIEVKGYGFTPGQWGGITLTFNITLNSGSMPQLRFYRSGSGPTISSPSYSGPGQLVNMGQLVPGIEDCYFQIITLVTGPVSFFIENAQITKYDGTP